MLLLEDHFRYSTSKFPAIPPTEDRECTFAIIFLYDGHTALVWGYLMMPLQATAHGDNETTFDSLVSQVRISPRTRNPRFSSEDSSNLDCAPQLRGLNKAVASCTTIGWMPTARFDPSRVNLRIVLSSANLMLDKCFGQGSNYHGGLEAE